MNEFRFEYPLALLLLVLPIAMGLWTWQRQRRTAAIFSSVRLLDGLPANNRKEPDRLEASHMGKTPIERLAEIAPACRISRSRCRLALAFWA